MGNVTGQDEPSRRTKARAHRARRAGGAAAAVAAALLLCHCGRDGAPTAHDVPPAPGDIESIRPWLEGVPETSRNVVLITLDTTRRDAVGVYGSGAGATPVLDSLASRAAVFDQVVTPVPVTLPAHTTLMTGRDPFEHGLRHNALFTASDTLVTLAERFKERGYTTAAFISGYPLHGSFGLDQGFDHYDDDLSDRAFAAVKETAERTAPRVNAAVLRWAEKPPAGPLFLWVHYFDPHYPYIAPAPFAGRFSNPYYAEIAFADHHVGTLLDGLQRGGLLDDAFIVIVGDHGESLGEHKESTHSFFVYDATQLVPCMILPPASWQGAKLRGERVAEQVRLRDLAPTIANLLGWPSDEWSGSGSGSLLPLLAGDRSPAGGTVEVAYVETFVPALEYGWSDLRGVRTSRWKYIRAPREELYDLKADPGETSNVAGDHPEVVERMTEWLDWYVAAESESAMVPQDVDPEVEERLRSLGYLGGGVAAGEETGADPKDRIEVHAAIALARQRGADYLYEDAVRILRPIVRRHSYLLEARRLLALYSYMNGDVEEARRMYEDLAEHDPENPRYRTELVPVLIAQGEADRALEVLNEVEELHPEEESIGFLRGQALESLGRLEEAVEVYRAESARDPEDASPRWNAARVLQLLGRGDEAYEELRKGLAADANSAPVLAALADLKYKEGKRTEADSLLASALLWDPHEPRANYLIGWQRQRRGDVRGAVEAYERAIRARPDFPEVRQNLAVLYLQDQRPEQARKVLETGLALGMETAQTRLNLGVALAQLGRVPEAAEHWEKGLQLNPSGQTAAQLRQNLAQARKIIEGGKP